MSGPGLNWKFIIKVTGLILILESLFLFISAGISWYYKEWDLPHLLLSAAITLVCGITLTLFGGKEKVKFIGKREGFLTVTLTWFLFGCFGTLPFYISGAIPSLSDAFFETMSGLTTTGATILTEIEKLPKGLHFWRSLTQWLGGMGVIVFSLAILPLIGGGGSQLFDAETTGITHDKFRPRVAQIAKRLWGIYLALSLILLALLWVGPMDFFDALCHTLTTISTGGYSTKQASIAYWNSTYIESVIIVFMIIGATNFSLLYFLLKGDFKRFFRDEELRWFLAIIIISSLLITFGLTSHDLVEGHIDSFRNSIFQVVSIVTTTGFATGDFVQWGPFYWIIFMILMVICGCAGSTSGGLKTIRIVVLFKNTFNELGRLIHPRAIIPVRINGVALSFGVVERLLAFTFLFIFVIIISWGVLTLSGMPFEEALGAAVTAISNVGPGFGSNGPSGSFANIPEFCKWYLSFLMLVGRLEFFTVLVLFTPGFWKR